MDKKELLQLIEKQHLEIKQLKNKYETEVAMRKLILQALPGPAFLKNTDGTYLWQNSCAKNYNQKFWCISNTLGKTDHDLYTKEIADRFKETDSIVLSGKNFIDEEKFILPDGKDHFYLTLKVPLFNKLSGTLNILGMSIDITAKKEIKESMQLTKRTLEVGNFLPKSYW